MQIAVHTSLLRLANGAALWPFDSDLILYADGPHRLGLAVQADNATILRCTEAHR